MNLDDMTTVVKICDANIKKLQANLKTYQCEFDVAYQALYKNWKNVNTLDGRLTAFHDRLLRSVSEVNEYVIKTNLRIDLNKPGSLLSNDDTKAFGHSPVEGPKESLEETKHTNQDGIEVGDNDIEHTLSVELSWSTIGSGDNESQTGLEPIALSSKSAKPTEQHKKISPSHTETPTTGQLNPITDQSKTQSQSETLKPVSPPSTPKTNLFKLPSLPMIPRDRVLFSPIGGKQMSNDETYDKMLKNIKAFATNSVIKATMMSLNIADNCFFVAKWDEQSVPLQDLLRGQLPVQEIDQLPNFGEIFGVYDAQENIIPRVVINAFTIGGGYDAYLVDYGEYLHLNDKEIIFALPDYIKALPAEAIKCYLNNQHLTEMRQYNFKEVNLRVLQNNGNYLEVELLKEVNVEDTKNQETTTGVQFSEAELAMLNNIEESTSNAVKAVLGFKPTDDQRICRHYDPKINGCFKGANCQLLHEPMASHGATKDVELVEPLLDAIFLPPAPIGQTKIARILVTFVSSPTQLYAQFVDQSAPLVWSDTEVPVEKREFKQMPHTLDMVLARYSDGNYYRAQIVEELENIGQFKIFYVDYGNTEFVTLSALAPCDNDISLKPHRAHVCIIAGIMRNRTLARNKSAECLEFLKSKLLNAELTVKKVRQSAEGFLIKLLGEFAELPKLMIQRGYVKPHVGACNGSSGSHSSHSSSPTPIET